MVHDQHVVEVEYQSDSQLPHSGYHWFHDLGENVGGTAQSKWEGLELPFLAFSIGMLRISGGTHESGLISKHP